MTTYTSLLSLLKPEGGDVVSVANFNTNADILDNSVLIAATQTLTNKTLTSPTISSPTVTGGATVGGGLAITSGGATVVGAVSITGSLGVTTNLGVGAAAAAGAGVFVSGSILGGLNQYGMRLNPTSSSAAVNVYGVAASMQAAAGSYTIEETFGLYTSGIGLGSGVSVTNSYGLYVESIFTGAEINYGAYIGEPSGGSVANIGLVVAGGGVLIEGIAPTGTSMLGLGGGAAGSATAGTNGAPPAQVVGYLIATWDSGQIRIPYYNA